MVGRDELVLQLAGVGGLSDADAVSNLGVSSLIRFRPEVVSEAGGWSVFIAGVPVAADGETFDAAIMEMVHALREYARDWQDHLLAAPNHQQNRGFVQLIDNTDDERLRGWLAEAAR